MFLTAIDACVKAICCKFLQHLSAPVYNSISTGHADFNFFLFDILSS